MVRKFSSLLSLLFFTCAGAGFLSILVGCASTGPAVKGTRKIAPQGMIEGSGIFRCKYCKSAFYLFSADPMPVLEADERLESGGFKPWAIAAEPESDFAQAWFAASRAAPRDEQ